MHHFSYFICKQCTNVLQIDKMMMQMMVTVHSWRHLCSYQ